MSLYDPAESDDERLQAAESKDTPATSPSPATSPEPDAGDLPNGPRKTRRTVHLGDAVLLQHLGPNNPDVSGSTKHLLPELTSEESDSSEDMDEQGGGPVQIPVASHVRIVERGFSSLAPAVQAAGTILSAINEISRSNGTDYCETARRRRDPALTRVSTDLIREERRDFTCGIPSPGTLTNVTEAKKHVSDGDDWSLRALLTQGSPEQKLPALITVSPMRQESGDSECSLPPVNELLMEVASNTNEAQANRNRDRQRTSSYSVITATSSTYTPSPMNPPLGSPIKFTNSHSMSPKALLDERSPSATTTLSGYTTSSSQTPPVRPTIITQRMHRRSPDMPMPHPLPTQSTSSDSTTSRRSLSNSASSETCTSRSQDTPTDGHNIVESPSQINGLYSDYRNVPLIGFKCKHTGCTAGAFQTQYLLNSHKNVHSSDRPHYCPIQGCKRADGGRGFKRKNEMIRHGLVHNSPGYVCPYCPDRTHTYPRPDNLQRHVHLHHKDKDKNDPRLRDVLAQRPPSMSANSSRRRRV